MKKLSKLLGILLIVALVMSMGAMAWAGDDTGESGGTQAATTTGSITVTGQIVAEGETTTTFEAYRIFDLKTNNDFSALSYSINSDWAGFFAAAAGETPAGAGAAYIVAENDPTANNGEGYTPIVIDGAVKYIALTESNIADFAKAALAYSQTTPVAPVASNTTGSFSNLPLGYYMVYPKGADLNVSPYTSIVSLTTTKPNATVVQKAEFPSLEKTDSDNSVEVGQTVTYTLTSKVPDTTGFDTFDFIMHDQMTKGLTFNGASTITVTIENGETDVTVPASAAENDAGYVFATETAGEGFETAFKISIPVMKYQDYIGQTITVTYTATVNDDAVTKVDKNHAVLEYSNNPKNENDHTTTPPDEETVFSAKIVINKFDGTNSNAKLEGAKFVLRCKSVADTGAQGVTATAEAGKYYKYTAASGDDPAKVEWVAETEVDAKVTANSPALESDVANGATVVTTNASGAAEFAGLENGVYELIEVKAPDGYNQIKGVATEVTVNGNATNTTSLTVTADVENNSGAELPSTGGIGTTIFYVVGGCMVLAALVLLITKKRMSREG